MRIPVTSASASDERSTTFVPVETSVIAAVWYDDEPPHDAASMTMNTALTRRFTMRPRELTIALSGRLMRLHFRHFIHHGPLQRVVRRLVQQWSGIQAD